MKTPTALEVMESPCASFCLKETLQKFLARDPLDALYDAEILVKILQTHWDNLKGVA